jgi:hypothetical protein
MRLFVVSVEMPLFFSEEPSRVARGHLSDDEAVAKMGHPDVFC